VSCYATICSSVCVYSKRTQDHCGMRNREYRIWKLRSAQTRVTSPTVLLLYEKHGPANNTHGRPSSNYFLRVANTAGLQKQLFLANFFWNSPSRRLYYRSQNLSSYFQRTTRFHAGLNRLHFRDIFRKNGLNDKGNNLKLRSLLS
jgi:hypothetical protein